MSDLMMKKNETTALSQETVAQWGSEAQHVDASNILIPKLLFMQGPSEWVAEGKAKIGDVVKSTTVEAIADAKGKAVEIIPLCMSELWAVKEKEGSKYVVRRKEPITPANRNEPLEFHEGGTEWRRDKCLDFYVLLKGDIDGERKAYEDIAKGEIPDVDAALVPCLISFSRSSAKAGKVLATHFAKAAGFKLPGAVHTFKLSTTIEKNDKGTYAVATVEKSGKTSVQDLEICKKWYDIIKSSNVQVHEVEDATAETATVDVNASGAKF